MSLLGWALPTPNSGHLHDLVARRISDCTILEGSWNLEALPSFQAFADTLVFFGPESADLPFPISFQEANVSR